MKRIAATAPIFAIVLSLFVSASTAAAQTPASANASKQGYAVVDVSYIFKKHVDFRVKMDGMKTKMQGIEQELQADQKTFIGLEEQKKRFNPGSPDFDKIDEQITRMKADMQIKMKKLRQDFLEEEAKYYFETYTHVSQAIKYHADKNGIALVLRFNGDQANPERREEILRDINKLVQYQNSVDITPDILALVNRGKTMPANITDAPTNIGSRPGARGGAGAQRR